jgi:hypothetical protein
MELEKKVEALQEKVQSRKKATEGREIWVNHRTI